MTKTPRLDSSNIDPIKVEEMKMRNQKLQRHNATTLNFGGVCLKNCVNRDIKCDECIRFSEYIEVKSK